MGAAELLREYDVLEKKAKELRGELRCRCECDGICATPEVWRAKQQLIDVTIRMDEINDTLGRERKLAYHQ